MNIRQLLKLLCDLSIISSTRNFFSQSPSGRQYPAASSELSGALQRVVDLSWTERNATITWKAHWRGGCKVAREKNEVTEERRSDLIRRFFVCPNFGSFFHLSVLLPPGSLFVLFFQAGKNLFFTPSFAVPSYLHTCPLTSFLTVFPPQPPSLLRVWHTDAYSYVSTGISLKQIRHSSPCSQLAIFPRLPLPLYLLLFWIIIFLRVRLRNVHAPWWFAPEFRLWSMDVEAIHLKVQRLILSILINIPGVWQRVWRPKLWFFWSICFSILHSLLVLAFVTVELVWLLMYTPK